MLIALNLSQKSALQLDLLWDSRFCLGHLKEKKKVTVHKVATVFQIGVLYKHSKSIVFGCCQ